jgi:hypothetical protein
MDDRARLLELEAEDIRSLVAARNDGGIHRSDWRAAALGRLKRIIVTGMKGVCFASMAWRWCGPNWRARPRRCPWPGR